MSANQRVAIGRATLRFLSRTLDREAIMVLSFDFKVFPKRRFPIETRQKYRCNPSCMVRLLRAVRPMFPKLGFSGSAIASANCGWLGKLKKSAEKVRRVCSPIGILKSFCTERSRLLTPGFLRFEK